MRLTTPPTLLPRSAVRVAAAGLLLGVVSAPARAVPQGLPANRAPALVWRGVPELTPRRWHAMAYDGRRERVVLFGGRGTGSPQQIQLGDTWEWDGAAWDARPVTGPAPAARSGAAMAFDPISKRVILFGGADESAAILHADTWAWDGRSWQQLQPATSPPKRWFAALAVNGAGDGLVLFGGASSFWDLGGYAPLADTWTWNGSDWIQRTPTSSPPARARPGMARHVGTRKLVLYAGTTGWASIPRDTWEWDGRDWSRAAVQTGPTYDYGEAKTATDPVNGHVLFHGGSRDSRVSDQTWQWDGLQWRELPVTNRPSVRFDPVLVCDEKRREVLVYGGWGSPDTWLWRAGAWHKAHEWSWPPTSGNYPRVTHDAARDTFVTTVTDPSTGRLGTWLLEEDRWVPSTAPPLPPGRDGAGLAYHAALREVVLFGGLEGSTARGDTWLWNGSIWRPDGSNTSPGRWPNPSLVYQDHSQRVLLGPYETMKQTWEWDATAGWMPRPSARYPDYYFSPIAYDPQRRRAVYYSPVPERNRGVWEWDGSQWTEIVPATRPTAPNGSVWHMAYSSALGGVVLFGGADALAGYVLPGLWLWNGKDWRHVPVGHAEHAPYWPVLALAHDTNRQRLRAFYMTAGGRRPASTAHELQVTSLSADPLLPRVSERASLLARLPHQRGLPFVLGLSSLSHPGIPLRGVPGGVEVLPLAPDGLLSWSLQAGMVVVLDGSGSGSIGLPIPNDQALVWQRLHAAGCTLSATGVGAITNRVELQIVP